CGPAGPGSSPGRNSAGSCAWSACDGRHIATRRPCGRPPRGTHPSRVGRVTSEPAATVGPVLIIGSGLLGASIGLALTALGVQVRLRDGSPAAQALARDLGAGELDEPGAEPPRLVVVATPPDVTAGLVGSALHTFPDAVVTDVASVKGVIVEELREFATLDLTRYVGSHPMAGREKSGASAATSELFAGRPW